MPTHTYKMRCECGVEENVLSGDSSERRVRKKWSESCVSRMRIPICFRTQTQVDSVCAPQVSSTPKFAHGREERKVGSVASVSARRTGKN